MPKKIRIADIGDYLKVFACTAVMMQPTISLVLATKPDHQTQFTLGIIYNLVKYTAPAFIFGILYSTTRTHEGAGVRQYPAYMKGAFQSLFVPSFWWTLVYLIVMPWVQQVAAYHNAGSFIWNFVNGNAAPHLWYNTMMLQFIILMPLFWALARLVEQQPQRGMIVAILTIIGYALWLDFYTLMANHGDWYLLDRFFVSFSIYGVLGVLAVKFADQVNHWLLKFWWLSLTVLGLAFLWTNYELDQAGFPLNLSKADYYKPSMTLYSLAVIACVAALCLYNTKRHHDRMLKAMHYLAAFAYKAYLSNIFWLQIVWHLSNRGNLHTAHPLGTLFLCWAVTWVLSFMSAVGLNQLWSRFKALW